MAYNVLRDIMYDLLQQSTEASFGEERHYIRTLTTRGIRREFYWHDEWGKEFEKVMDEYSWGNRSRYPRTGYDIARRIEKPPFGCCKCVKEVRFLLKVGRWGWIYPYEDRIARFNCRTGKPETCKIKIVDEGGPGMFYYSVNLVKVYVELKKSKPKTKILMMGEPYNCKRCGFQFALNTPYLQGFYRGRKDWPRGGIERTELAFDLGNKWTSPAWPSGPSQAWMAEGNYKAQVYARKKGDSLMYSELCKTCNFRVDIAKPYIAY